MTDNSSAGIKNDLIRTLSSWLLDRPAYWLLGIIYQIFFNVASAELFTNATIKNFYNRVQLIIGVFMIFFLVVKILQWLINPDQMSDPKQPQNNFGNVISRVILALVMLVVLVPINIPNAKTEYEIQLNNNGLLFGTLYSLQNRLLSNNTLGRLILGTTDNQTADSVSQGEKLQQSTNIFTSTILKGFLRINLVPENERKECGGKDPELCNENRMCPTIDDDILKLYTALDASPSDLLDLINTSCTDASGGGIIASIKEKFKRISGKERYLFAYIPIFPAVIALVFAFVLLGFTVDIAIRAIKLAVLRLIAPIPIISYIDPKSAKDGAFASWVKALSSTYLDLFIRLAVIYFVIFLIQDMIVNGVIINNGTGMIGILSCIFIWLGLFFFVRQAPKFFRDILGLKGNMGNIGLSAMLGGTAMLAGGGGVRGALLGAMQGAESSLQATNQGKAMPIGQVWSQNRDMMAKIRTGDKDARGGIIGTAMDRMNYDSRERRAALLGIGNQDLADAKYLKDTREAMAQATKQDLDYATQALNSLDPNASAAERAAARTRYEQAYRKNQAYQVEAAKAASAYDKMDKDRALMGVAPRVSDKRARKYTVRQRMNNTFGTDFTTSNEERGTYRSPLAVTNQPVNYDASTLPDDPNSSRYGTDNRSLIRNIEGHRRDLKNFSGTTDDENFGAAGHGSGPRGGPPPGRP